MRSSSPKPRGGGVGPTERCPPWTSTVWDQPSSFFHFFTFKSFIVGNPVLTQICHISFHSMHSDTQTWEQPSNRSPPILCPFLHLLLAGPKKAWRPWGHLLWAVSRRPSQPQPRGVYPRGAPWPRKAFTWTSSVLGTGILKPTLQSIRNINNNPHSNTVRSTAPRFPCWICTLHFTCTQRG